jgi:hypothetical protein
MLSRINLTHQLREQLREQVLIGLNGSEVVTPQLREEVCLSMRAQFKPLDRVPIAACSFAAIVEDPGLVYVLLKTPVTDAPTVNGPAGSHLSDKLGQPGSRGL